MFTAVASWFWIVKFFFGKTPEIAYCVDADNSIVPVPAKSNVPPDGDKSSFTRPPYTVVLASGNTTVYGGLVNLVLSPSGGTLDLAGTGTIGQVGHELSASTQYAISGVTIQNQDATAVNTTTNTLYYTFDGSTAAALSYGTTMTPGAATGATSLTIYDYNALAHNWRYTGVTYIVNVV